ncbi:MAG TPA: hypothetical protein VGN05_06130 [Parvibaculum sp.]
MAIRLFSAQRLGKDRQHIDKINAMLADIDAPLFVIPFEMNKLGGDFLELPFLTHQRPPFAFSC